MIVQDKPEQESASAVAEPLRLGYMRGAQQSPVSVQLHEPRRAGSPQGVAILGVVAGNDLDASVQDLSGDLAAALNGPLYVVRPVRVPAALPGRLPSDVLATLLGCHAAAGGPAGADLKAAEVDLLLCRDVGPALVAEAVDRRCAGIVIGAPHGNALARWRRGGVVHYLLRHAPCRVYVVEDAVAAVTARLRAAGA